MKEVIFYLEDDLNEGNDVPIPVDRQFAEMIRCAKREGIEKVLLDRKHGIETPVDQFNEIH